jgi:NADPH-dependent glutamate synthase beta subunit-like oxidoreductase/NAD-dependent dihydropyrimidine dehydrogenase PreA subunit
MLSDTLPRRPQTKNVNKEWLGRNFPCYWACPVHTEAGRYVRYIADGDYKSAYYMARLPNPFASICGRICAAPCETACRRGKIDKPIAIRALKRFACERYGVESLIDITRIKEVFAGRIKPLGRWVAVVGSGPAGLSAAHDLALMGYSVTVFESQMVAGGMLRLGVPEYRLPRELIRLEINAILNLGLELRLGKAIGRDFALNDLFDNGYEAVFLAVGAHRGRSLNIPGVELDGVFKAIDFLLNINLGYKVDLGERIVVVGGGNVAIDVARTAARQEPPPAEIVTDISSALDVARSAVRFGAREVHVVSLESLQEMPATEEEIREAEDERIVFHHSKGPNRIIGKNGKVTALETVDCVSVFDENRRFNPKFAPGTEGVIPADSVILAIGQSSDLSFLSPNDEVRINPRNTIEVDPESLSTSQPAVFAGGDVAFGPRNIIDAIADGRRAALAIKRYLGDSTHENEELLIEVLESTGYGHSPSYERIPRQLVPFLPIDRRIGVAQVELGYTEGQARKEAERCLWCWENTIFDGQERFGTECILCGGCVDICPEDCIELVPLASVEVPRQLEEEIGETFAYLNLQPADFQRRAGAAMIKDEEKCIRCGLCAKRCPVNCITMERFLKKEPARLGRQE